MGQQAQFRNLPEETGQPGFHWEFDRHAVSFLKRSRRLVVTFDNMKSRDAPAPRIPWGAEFLESRGVSHLGIMMKRRNDWYRHRQLWGIFDRFRREGFFKAFEDVLFYGSSMGGYGALTFARAAPGARVLAFVPQTSLRAEDVPGEDRWRKAYERGDWDSPAYRDGAEGIRDARQVQVFYDPYEAQDRAQVERLKGPQVELFPMPFTGHKAPRKLRHLGLLSETVTAALEGRLTQADFRREYRVRMDRLPYVRLLLERARVTGHAQLALAGLERAVARHPDWKLDWLRKDFQDMLKTV